MMYFIICIAVVYFLLISSLIIGFDKVEITKNKKISPKNSFSIVIPFRNEAKNLPVLLNSISNLQYPKNFFEILLINDDSSDDFKTIINEFKILNKTVNIQLIENERKTHSPKKDAIVTAVKHSKFEWLVTTDADCEVPQNWLLLFNQFIEEKKPFFISAPVKFKTENTFLFHFQNLNFISLIGSTIGGFGLKKPFMCNGANLCYKKDIFICLNAFEGNNNIASGDDVFLLEKMNESYPNKTLYLKSNEATVVTKTENSWKHFLHQQLRWTSKSTAYSNIFSKFTGIVVLLLNASIVLTAILSLSQSNNWKLFLMLLLQKMIVDFVLIYKTSKFITAKKTLNYFFLISLLYPFFVVFIASLSLFKRFEWKGRTFKK
ncbi:glycosyltransferase [Lutibacter sp. B1]|uniref:glycosyltransferase family 2 protein n=1 Tax=Lutibacter sp. B1 TaxID=2725996 RepID=UPI0014578326|nr:glycosyltransferase [Lutibacter sp. B1]NLP59167.1 glycosyltransferase [Lutibacter sp. B1]